MMIWRCELHHKANVRTTAVNETAEKTVQSAGSEDGSYNPKELVYERAEGTSGSWEPWSLFSTSICLMDFQ